VRRNIIKEKWSEERGSGKSEPKEGPQKKRHFLEHTKILKAERREQGEETSVKARPKLWCAKNLKDYIWGPLSGKGSVLPINREKRAGRGNKSHRVGIGFCYNVFRGGPGGTLEDWKGRGGSTSLGGG